MTFKTTSRLLKILTCGHLKVSRFLGFSNKIARVWLQIFLTKLIEVFDASAKVSSGILSGNINNFGDFNECLQARSSAKSASGKYCLAYVNVDVPEEMRHLRDLKKLSHSLETFKGNFTEGFDDVSFEI